MSLDGASVYSASAMIALSDQQVITWVNRAMEELLGFPASMITGLRCHEVFEGLDVHGNRYCGQDCPAHRIRSAGGTPNPFVLDVRGRAGRERVQVHTVRIDNTFLLLFAALRDAPRALMCEPPSTPPPPPPPPMSSRPAPASTAPEGRHLLDPLTPRETQVLKLLADGLTTPSIAERLGISDATVRNHVQRVLQKLDAHSRLEAVASARDLGIL